MTANGPVTYLQYACLNASRKGRAFCENGRTIGLLKIENKVINGLRERMLHPVAVQEFIAKFLARAKSQSGEDTTAQRLAALTSQIEQQKRDAEKLMDLYLGGADQAPEVVRQRLEKCESERRELERQAEALRHLPRRTADALPHPAMIVKYAQQLSATLAGKRERARAALERHVGKITLTLRNEGPTPTYWASGLFDFGPVDDSRRYQQVAGARSATYLRLACRSARGSRSVERLRSRRQTAGRMVVSIRYRSAGPGPTIPRSEHTDEVQRH